MDSKLFFVCLLATLPAVLGTFFPYNCTEFCLDLAGTCTGANQQYPIDSPFSALTLCESACAISNTTNSTSYGDDTYDCRYYHQNASISDANYHCKHAGPMGGYVCGSPQEAYCDLVLSACTGSNAQYADSSINARQICLATGASWGINTTSGLQLPFATNSGYTINCHEYHSLVAAQGGSTADTHCPHAGPYGAGVCGTPVENFCSLVQHSCPDNYAAYPSWAACIAVASTFPAQNGPLGSEVSGNSLGCRAYHASVAAYIPNPHCFHTSAGGGATCGSECDGYCSIIQSVCNGTNAKYAYADTASCLTACAKFNTTAFYHLNNTNQAAPNGDTLDCRLYHATAAAYISADTHCPHAAVDGGGVCVAQNAPNSAFSWKVAFGPILSLVIAASVFLLA